MIENITVLGAVSSSLTLDATFATVLYAIAGAFIMMIAYKVFDIINPIDFDKEISNNNTALGILLAGFFIALSIIIASAIVG